jgi:hypothetical protein
MFDIGGSGQEYQRITAFGIFVAADLDQPQLVAEKIQRAIQISDPDHGMQISHVQLSSANG